MANSDFERARYQHESTDASGRSVVWAAVVIIMILALSGFFVFSLFIYFGGNRYAILSETQAMLEAERVPPPPHLHAQPGVGFQKLREEKEKLLYSYGWINKENGIIHIPIEQAMNLLVEKGLPTAMEKSRNYPQERE